MSVLLLQGPLGPFFDHLAKALRADGQRVYKIHFNGGDGSYYSGKAVNFTQALSQWPEFIRAFIAEHEVSLVMAYGDCRSYHAMAKQVCAQLDITYIALEEGYLRPNYITLEVGGANGHSPIKHAGVEAYQPVHSVQDEFKIPGNFLKRVRYAARYYNVAFFKRSHFKEYVHHRSFSPVYEALRWHLAFARKQLYKITEPNAKRIIRKGEFFLVPLQVYNDAQLEFHSQYDSIEHFIQEVMMSYAMNQCSDRLVFKHHPMDRGHKHYGAYIKTLARELGVSSNVQYIHDQHLPTLLKGCKGVVTINSTTALQAFYHEAAVKVMGDAFFNMPGLTDQKPLADFWSNPEKPDIEFADRFRAYLLDHGQINGSFYSKFAFTCSNIMDYMKRHKMLNNR